MKDKILGIDYGTKNIGIAISDDFGTIAFPLVVLENNKEVIEKIKNLSEKEDFSKIVIGDPGIWAQETRRKVLSFAEELEKEGFLVSFEKEFMTSLHANMFTKKKPIARQTKQNREAKKDQSAAALILQRFLDKQKLK